MSEHPSREEQRARTRGDLLDAAATVFAEHGYHAASVDQVAEAAGYTKGAVYSNFSSKEELFLALFDAHLNRAVETLEELYASTSPEERASAVGERAQMLQLFDREWFLLETEFLLFAARNEQWRERFAARQRQTREQIVHLVGQHLEDLGISDPDELAEDLARLMIATADGLMMMRLSDPEGTEPARLMTELLELLTRGVDDGDLTD